MAMTLGFIHEGRHSFNDEINQCIFHIPSFEPFAERWCLELRPQGDKSEPPADLLGEILDTPKLRQHLGERRVAIAALVPRMQKWVKIEERKRQLEQERKKTAVRRNLGRPSRPQPGPNFERQRIWSDTRNTRNLSDE
jgi:hypothetical protein